MVISFLVVLVDELTITHFQAGASGFMPVTVCHGRKTHCDACIPWESRA